MRTLRHTSKQFRHGRQEDAHEYARCLLEACQKEKSGGRIKREVNGKEQISNIFGGRLCSQVKCLSAKCHYVSNIFEPFLDLSLEITRASTLAKALHRFTAVEILDGANKYECEKCRSRVRASKRFWIETPPNILTIHLKRFEFGAYGRKIDKHVKFPTTLDMTPHLRMPGRCKHLYTLYAVLVHAGHSTHSGHYYSFVRAPSGMWHIMDDGRVRQVAENHVLAQNAYILFYVRNVECNRDSKSTAKTRKTTESQAQTQVHQNGSSHSHHRNEQIMKNIVPPHTNMNGGEGNNRNLKAKVLSYGDGQNLSNGDVHLHYHEDSVSVMSNKSKSESKSEDKGVVQRENGISFGNRSMLTFFSKKILPFLKARHSIEKKRSIVSKFTKLFRRRSEPDLLETDIKSDDLNGLSPSGCRKRKKMKSELDDIDCNEYEPHRQSINKRENTGGQDNNRVGERKDMKSGNGMTDKHTFSDFTLSNGHTANILNVEQWDDLDDSLREKAKKLNRNSMPKVREVDEW